jgi:tetratricopeptide (TPR) repeat protein/tRNA A-37 threonylcarbamoyl transferase component Bud32
MEAERYERVGALLVAALERPPHERGPFLEEACSGDDLLKKEVETLLRSHDAAGSFLEGPAVEALGLGAETALEGKRVGPYRLLTEIGRGGMGVVYMAARSDEAFEKRVAIKLIKRGMDTEEIVRRFKKERRILAALDHPNIARVLDGGTTDEGLPYFVMEYVDGLPLLEFCDARGLSTVERLKLFCSVCSAVQFAHQNLVVHRDLKPSNILVDAGGVPRLLDFGIAKLLAVDEEATRTVTGLRPMTPQYSSPEQIRGETINTTSDIYSLGVLLYEVLAGVPPYRVEGATPTEIERAICEEEPERPSVAVARRGRSAPGDDTRRLRRRLAGDLDTIVLLALRKDPRRRYASVERLSDDIRRHLAGFPIGARKDTLLYRGGKFVRRHAFGVAAAAAFMLLAVAATATLAVQRARIERERLRAEQTSEFLVGLFKGSDPRQVQGETLTVRDVLDRGAKQIERDLAGQPEVQTSLMDTIGGIYRELGLFEEAGRMLEAAYQTRRRLFGDADLRVAQSLQSLGLLRIVTGDYAEAERFLRQVLEVRRRRLGEKDLLVAESLHNLAIVMVRKGEPVAAEELLRRVLEIETARLGERDLAVADTWNVLSSALQAKGDYDGAELALRKAIEIVRASPERDLPKAATYQNNLATILMGKGAFGEAARLYRESSENRRLLVGEGHPEYGGVLANLAAALTLDGKTDEAEALARKALEIRRRALGDQHPDVGVGWNVLATVLRAKGDAADAERAAREALRVLSAQFPEGHPILSAPMLTLGWARCVKSEREEGEPLLRKALEIRSRALKEGDWRIAEAESLLGACLASQGQRKEASALLTKSLGVLSAKLGPSHPLTLSATQARNVLR